MIPREILEQALVDYQKAVEEIQGMERIEAARYLRGSGMKFGMCSYLKENFNVCRDDSISTFGDGYLGGSAVLGIFPDIPTLTARLQLRINKLKELLNDNPLPLPK